MHPFSAEIIAASRRDEFTEAAELSRLAAAAREGEQQPTRKSGRREHQRARVRRTATI
jgi:hypothetical protein